MWLNQFCYLNHVIRFLSYEDAGYMKNDVAKVSCLEVSLYAEPQLVVDVIPSERKAY